MHAKDLLSKYAYSPDKNLDDLIVVIRHRGAPKNEKVIYGSKIKRVTKHNFEYEEKGKVMVIPIHRIVRVIDIQNDKVLWTKNV